MSASPLIVQSKRLLDLGVIHGISTRDWGNMSYDRQTQNLKGEARENLHKFLEALGLKLKEISLVLPQVNHTANIARVDFLEGRKGRLILRQEHNKQIGNFFRGSTAIGIDACITNTPNTFLAILPADCAPIMLFDPKGYWALVHAGKQGTQSGIIPNTILNFRTWCKANAQDLICFVGPAICGQCYKPNGDFFDLKGLIRSQLLMAGLKEANIEISNLCTFHDKPLFFSHHRNSLTGRHLALIGKK